MGGSGPEFGLSIALDSNNNIHIAGSFYSKADFDPGIGVFNLNTIGNWDAFITKLSGCSLTVEIPELNEDNHDINISPNPSQGIFTVNYKNKTSDAKICVYDLLGNCVLRNITVKELNQRIDLGDQPGGIYFVEILLGGEKTTRKIIIK